jgi:hypothetical protein
MKRVYMKILNILAIVGAAFIATACGNINSPTENFRTSSYGLTSDAGSTNPYLSPAQQCSETPNVVSSVYQYANGTQYRACKGATNGAMNVKIFTFDNSTKSICMFPVQVVTGSTPTPFVVSPNSPAQSRYAMQCTTATGNGATLSFGSLPVAGVYVVDSANAGTFAQCLAYGDVDSCSSASGFTYSFGRL